MTSSLFKSKAQAQHYAKFRPLYPNSIFAMIASSVEGNKRLAVDVGCGSGQATVALAEHFDNVIGVDPSEAQIQHATPHDNVTYQLGDANCLPVEGESVAAVVAAQAAHWFDIPKFYQEVHRVLQPGGCLALLTYGNPEFRQDQKLQKMVTETLYEDVLGKGGYWDDRRFFVENRYRDIPLLSEESPKFRGERILAGYDIDKDLAKEDLIGYLRSWSGYVTYCKEHSIKQESPNDPIEPIRQYLHSEPKYQNSGIRAVFPVTCLLSVKKRE
jgi:SAM-dependent methyltransferase